MGGSIWTRDKSTLSHFMGLSSREKDPSLTLGPQEDCQYTSQGRVSGTKEDRNFFWGRQKEGMMKACYNPEGAVYRGKRDRHQNI
jgi:hypothetical protein